MNSIKRTVEVNLPAKKAFLIFINDISEWWPKEYTWSKDHLAEMRIDPKIDGLCTEIGPHDFRCDWGRVIDIQDGEHLKLKWQISYNRVPEPDPDKGSEISINFIGKGETTMIEFEHSKFENHGEHAQNYFNAMNSNYGWDFILKSYSDYSNT